MSIKEVEKVHTFAAQQKLFIVLRAAYYLYGTLYLLVVFLVQNSAIAWFCDVMCV